MMEAATVCGGGCNDICDGGYAYIGSAAVPLRGGGVGPADVVVQPAPGCALREQALTLTLTLALTLILTLTRMRCVSRP